MPQQRAQSSMGQRVLIRSVVVSIMVIASTDSGTRPLTRCQYHPFRTDTTHAAAWTSRTVIGTGLHPLRKPVGNALWRAPARGGRVPHQELHKAWERDDVHAIRSGHSVTQVVL